MVRSVRSGRPFAVMINDLIGAVAPRLALSREIARSRRDLLVRSSHYDAAGRSDRAKDFRVNRSDAVEAGRYERGRLSWIARDMLRNNPRVVKAQRQLVNKVVAKGIMPSVVPANPDDLETKSRVEKLIRMHWGRTSIDADGLCNIFGQQGLSLATTALSGEVFLRRRFRRAADRLPLPYQVQALEPDYLVDTIDGTLPNGNRAVQGIEFDRLGRRVAYHFYAEHPGGRYGAGIQVRRVAAENVIHVFDMQRPGQARGVTWFAPILTLLHELQKYQDGQVKRQEIAAMFAAILKHEEDADALKEDFGELRSGAILNIGSDEEMTFTDPPTVEGYEPFMRGTDRTLAGGLGLTYEEFTGDYSNVNYSSARMGRIDTEPNTERWQSHMMVPMFCDRQAEWFKEAAAFARGIDPDSYDIVWTPPKRPLVDPRLDFAAFEKARRAGFASRRSFIRQTGNDPAAVEAEILEEQKWANENELAFSSDGAVSATGGAKATSTERTENE